MENSNLQKIVWSRTMEEYGVDNSWMVSRFNPDNAIELTPEESKEVEDKVKKFKKRL